jgi:hypothetical protein
VGEDGGNGSDIPDVLATEAVLDEAVMDMDMMGGFGWLGMGLMWLWPFYLWAFLGLSDGANEGGSSQ